MASTEPRAGFPLWRKVRLYYATTTVAVHTGRTVGIKLRENCRVCRVGLAHQELRTNGRGTVGVVHRTTRLPRIASEYKVPVGSAHPPLSSFHYLSSLSQKSCSGDMFMRIRGRASRLRFLGAAMTFAETSRVDASGNIQQDGGHFIRGQRGEIGRAHV